MRRLASRSALAVASLVVAVALAACTGGSTPILTGIPSATASPSPSASPDPSTSLAPLTDAELLALLPPDAAYPDVRGAIETAIFFVAQFPIVYETGDLQVWDALSMPECIFCQSVRGNVRAETAVGDHEIGGKMTVDRDSIVANYYDVDGYWYVTFHYSQNPSFTQHADGKTEPSGDGGTGSTSLRMAPIDGIWKVCDVGVEPD